MFHSKKSSRFERRMNWRFCIYMYIFFSFPDWFVLSVGISCIPIFLMAILACVVLVQTLFALEWLHQSTVWHAAFVITKWNKLRCGWNIFFYELLFINIHYEICDWRTLKCVDRKFKPIHSGKDKYENLSYDMT